MEKKRIEIPIFVTYYYLQNICKLISEQTNNLY